MTSKRLKRAKGSKQKMENSRQGRIKVELDYFGYPWHGKGCHVPCRWREHAGTAASTRVNLDLCTRPKHCSGSSSQQFTLARKHRKGWGHGMHVQLNLAVEAPRITRS